jgi:hypothetical protein
MKICHSHNLNRPPEGAHRYGIRVTLPPDESFAAVIGSDWERLYWYPTTAERDRALHEMARRHEYSRRGDKPTVVFQKVERDASAAA